MYRKATYHLQRSVRDFLCGKLKQFDLSRIISDRRADWYPMYLRKLRGNSEPK